MEPRKHTKKPADARCSESCRSDDCYSSTCNVDENNSELSVQTNAHSHRCRLFQLTVIEVPKAGQRCSESCRSVDWSASTCKSTKTTANSVQTNAHSHRCRLFQLTGLEATTAGPRCSESCRSVDCRTSTCKIDENNSKLSVQTNAHSHRCRLFQLTVAEATTAGPRYSESCRSVDCCTSTCKIDENNRNLSVQTTATAQTHHPRRPLFQLTGTQATTAGPRCSESCRSVDWRTRPCKKRRTQQNLSGQTTATTQTHHPSSPLFQLTVFQATTAGPRCSESCRSVDCCTRTWKIDETNKISVQTTHRTPVVVSLQLTVP
jgi:hypothetical protein